MEVSANLPQHLELDEPNFLMDLLSTNQSDIPSTLKFIYNREISGIAEYLKMFSWYACGTLNVNHQTTSRDFHHPMSSGGGRDQHRTGMERR